MIGRLAEGLAQRARHGMLRVAVDGPDHAGKTVFARDLVDAVRPLVRNPGEVRRFCTDDHLVPIQVRRSPAAADPRWLYDNMFRLDEIRGVVEGVPELDPPGSVLVVDGMTLQRPDLADLWHATIYLTVPEEVVIERVIARDYDLFDSLEEVLRRYRERYLPTQRLYRDAVAPQDRADVLIDMTDFEAPRVLRWGSF